MLDCGMHMGYQDDRRFPDFNFIAMDEPLTEHIDAVIISHFHLDHCGALPYMTEMVGYNGKIYMTGPTMAIAPHLLEDMRKVAVDRKGETNFFTSQMIKDCMRKVVPVNLHQVIRVDDEMEIKAYYAGHVLGAAMFHIRVGEQSLVYTGDYNMTPDRHLGAAWIDKCRPDLLISESTYATTIRDSKRCRERDFLKKVHDCVDRGGKVLIPVFALGRAQELCILLETYWERMNLKVPVFFSTGLTEKANNYYKMFITWTNEKIRKTFVERNMFDFKHIKGFDRSLINNEGPMVVLSTPGMLHGGLSLQIFEEWCGSEQNMIIMPGYCVAGTVGHKILNGTRTLDRPGKAGKLEVKMSVQYMSFSAHADAKGIMQLISYCEPKNVMLVHGEGHKMEFLKHKIRSEYGIECYMPANGQTAVVKTSVNVPVAVARSLLDEEAERYDTRPPDSGRKRTLDGILVTKDDGTLRIINPKDAQKELGVEPHTMRFTNRFVYKDANSTLQQARHQLLMSIKEFIQSCTKMHGGGGNPKGLEVKMSDTSGEISVNSILVKVDTLSMPGMASDSTSKEVVVSWANSDEYLGSKIFTMALNQCSDYKIS